MKANSINVIKLLLATFEAVNMTQTPINNAEIELKENFEKVLIDSMQRYNRAEIVEEESLDFQEKFKQYEATAIEDNVWQKDVTIADPDNWPEDEAEDSHRSNQGVSTRSHALVKRFTGLYTGPFFDTNNPKNFTAQLGTHAYLPCKVRQLGNKSVSWVRKKDAHILSVDRVMFIADERFQAIFVDGSETWTLQVKYVQARDEGDYECQISTEPKMSHFVHLNVVVPKVEIVGDRDRFVRTGSTVSLRCVINQSLEAPSYVFWYHKGHRVLSDPYGKLVIHPPTRTETGFDSSLVIDNARAEDSGNYTCSPSNLDSASATLHVLNGEHPAAIQRGISAAPGGCRALWWLAGSVSLSSNHGRRIFVLVVLISMALFTYQRSLRLAYIGVTSIVP